MQIGRRRYEHTQETPEAAPPSCCLKRANGTGVVVVAVQRTGEEPGGGWGVRRENE